MAAVGEELTAVLTGYRRRVQTAWTPDTAHPGHPAGAGDPAGQCGVTSAWLQERLYVDHGITSTYYAGTVHIAGREHGPHCWLVAAGEVVDLTGSQYGLPDVVYGVPAGVRYVGRPSVGPLSRLALLRVLVDREVAS